MLYFGVCTINPIVEKVNKGEKTIRNQLHFGFTVTPHIRLPVVEADLNHFKILKWQMEHLDVETDFIRLVAKNGRL